MAIKVYRFLCFCDKRNCHIFNYEQFELSLNCYTIFKHGLHLSILLYHRNNVIIVFVMLHSCPCLALAGYFDLPVTPKYSLMSRICLDVTIDVTIP